MIIRVNATTGRETGEKLNNSIDNRLAARWMAVDTKGLTSAATAQGGGKLRDAVSLHVKTLLQIWERFSE